MKPKAGCSAARDALPNVMPAGKDHPESGCSLEEVRAAKAETIEAFERLALVVGVGVTRIGTGYGLKVNLQRKPGAKTSLPANIKGVPVRVEVVGTPRKRAAAAPARARAGH